MHIKSTQISFVPQKNSARPQGSPEQKAKPPADSVTFSSSSRLPSIVLHTAFGGVPLLGAASNAMLMGADGASTGQVRINFLAAASNLGGTASLVYGVFAGNETAVNTGLGLLGASAVTAGISCASLM